MVVLTIADDGLQVLLIERGEEPFLGRWALPGGIVGPDEGLHAAAVRVLQAETGVKAARHLEQLGAYGDPGRDPRWRVVTIAYLAVIPDLGPV